MNSPRSITTASPVDEEQIVIEEPFDTVHDQTFQPERPISQIGGTQRPRFRPQRRTGPQFLRSQYEIVNRLRDEVNRIYSIRDTTNSASLSLDVAPILFPGENINVFIVIRPRYLAYMSKESPDASNFVTIIENGRLLVGEIDHVLIMRLLAIFEDTDHVQNILQLNDRKPPLNKTYFRIYAEDPVPIDAAVYRTSRRDTWEVMVGPNPVFKMNPATIMMFGDQINRSSLVEDRESLDNTARIIDRSIRPEEQRPQQTYRF